MSEAVQSDLYFYVDDSCLMCQHKDINYINRQLNEDFSNLCDWFVNNKLSIHFGEDKTKSIVFASKQKLKKIGKLNITYNNKEIKQFSKLSYLGNILEESMSGESMALSVLHKINSRLNFLYRKSDFLTYDL